jgi:hypothetical protein
MLYRIKSNLLEGSLASSVQCLHQLITAALIYVFRMGNTDQLLAELIKRA